MDFQKEMRIRRRVENIFNKRCEDFDSVSEYNDYEEQREDVIYNLVEGIDLAETEARIADYQKKNYDNIVANDARKAESIRLDAEKNVPAASSSLPIAKDSQTRLEESGATFRASDASAILPPGPAMVDGKNKVDALGTVALQIPGANDHERMAFASGWHPEMPRKRALQEAFSTIFVT